MYTKATIDNFINCKNIALLGASRTGKKFGNIIIKELTKKGYNILPVHPNADSIDNIKCYRSIEEIKDKAEGVIFVIKPILVPAELKKTLEAGITKVWLQQGSESDEAIKFCENNNLDAVYRQCILMFTPSPGFMHGTHKFIWKMIGKIPK
jgi:predicted CoA-binding protein